MIRHISRISSQFSKPFTVIIEGNIGSGKSTFLQHFENHKDVCVLSEPVEMWRNCAGHNLLANHYENPVKWSFTFQSYIQLTMLQRHTFVTSKPIKLLERSIFSARYCFIEQLFRRGTLEAPSVSVLNEWFKYVITKFDVSVDLIVYLRTSPEVVYERVLTRNRKEEQSVSLQYLKDLHDLHENWLFHKTAFSRPAHVLTLNADLGRLAIREEYQKCEDHLLSVTG
ncbi:hypothetical protein PPYR_14905 [Photinus pyralis]|uniref:Deoxynucleoside kinase domain-containing protein n=1 Tax=Photinus pyralis TaxID=7054 RepID=A0A1Y1N5E8_PHOPY|nr:deoxynucleoside kinase-like [Photinus pyralis]XP_031359314.1 deoxynucleoside kinase-like [Photinus pyralis]KAB0790013.1 hypothetical protein PPYR_15694 [Photinus pyralis]KAB0790652.1 hypothetical protein PPYR_14905 [Photinus pyralis]